MTRSVVGLLVQFGEMLFRILFQRGFAAGAADEDSAAGEIDRYRATHRIQIGSSHRADFLLLDELQVCGGEFVFLNSPAR